MSNVFLFNIKSHNPHFQPAQCRTWQTPDEWFCWTGGFVGMMNIRGLASYNCDRRTSIIPSFTSPEWRYLVQCTVLYSTVQYRVVYSVIVSSQYTPNILYSKVRGKWRVVALATVVLSCESDNTTDRAAVVRLAFTGLDTDVRWEGGRRDTTVMATSPQLSSAQCLLITSPLEQLRIHPSPDRAGSHSSHPLLGRNVNIQILQK